MQERIDKSEQFLRAVRPDLKEPRYWRNGKLSTAAFKDKKGLSVQRTGDRSMSDTVSSMKARKFMGAYVSVAVKLCLDQKIFIDNPPSKDLYHRELHGSETEKQLTEEQAFYLARFAKVEYDPLSCYKG